MTAKYFVILGTGIIAGILNTMAGGGSMLSVPVLIFMGLPPAVANGTNRIALMVEGIIAVTTFRSKGYFDLRLSLLLGLPALTGSILGAGLAINTPDRIFNKIIAAVMLVVMVLIMWQPQKRIHAASKTLDKKRMIAAIISFFFIGVYGGFIQLGIGFIMIAALSLIFGMSLVKINSIKMFVGLIYMISSFLVFVVSGKVDWGTGLVLAVGNGAGAWLGSNFTVAGGEKWVKIMLFVAVAFMSGRLLRLF